MSSRFRRMPSYHYVDNTDGNILNPAANVLRDYTISGNHGKNLIPYPFPYHSIYGVKNGITVTDSGNSSITLNGTATASTPIYLTGTSEFSILSGKYFFSGIAQKLSGLSMSIEAITDDGVSFYSTDHGGGGVLNAAVAANAEKELGVNITIRISKGAVLENVIVKPQLEKYNARENLIPYPYSNTTKTDNGITFTDNGDGTITANGTATGRAQFFARNSSNKLLIDDNYTYVFSGCPQGGSSSTYSLEFSAYNNNNLSLSRADYGSGTYFESTELAGLTGITAKIVISKGATVNNLVFSPRIEKYHAESEPYKAVGDYDTESGKYKIPVKNGNEVTNILLDAPVKPGESINKINDNLPDIKLHDGTNVLTVQTEVKPSAVNWQYYKY